MCHNIIELHKTIEKQITHIFNNTNDLKEKQIKGDSHMQELSNGVDFITKKFDKYQKERNERKEIINNLTENVSQKVNDLSEALEKHEQYSGCKSLLLHGIPGKNQKETDELCIKAVNEHLNLAINNINIGKTHCIGNPRNAGEKPRPIIIKLMR